MPAPCLGRQRLYNATGAGNGATPDLVLVTPAAASVALLSIQKRDTPTAALPNTLTTAPRDAYTVMAHAMECLLRPSRTGTTCTKAQQADIRKTGSLNLAKARMESNCCTQTPMTSQDQTMAMDSELTTLPSAQSMASPFRATTLPPHVPADSPPATAQAVRFATPKPQNRFDVLLNEHL
ncbi:hypothetical protein CNMCM5793_007860 [Aspergillus hiratsukae]|uniref:Uncharacterized protein n=1 Tax=Aspergillus hiratsukae TaxID=1194566 RepID=A0A8H6PHQ6_9EURO|nr:hypothetical protein CNMCM5793_007860 [Aspergillus hiratsukae]